MVSFFHWVSFLRRYFISQKRLDSVWRVSEGPVNRGAYPKQGWDFPGYNTQISHSTSKQGLKSHHHNVPWGRLSCGDSWVYGEIMIIIYNSISRTSLRSYSFSPKFGYHDQQNKVAYARCTKYWIYVGCFPQPVPPIRIDNFCFLCLLLPFPPVMCLYFFDLLVSSHLIPSSSKSPQIQNVNK